MNAKWTPRFPTWTLMGIVVAGWLAHGIARSEVVAIAGTGISQRRVVLELADTEDPTPFNGIVWRKVSPIDTVHATLNPEGEASGDGAPSIIAEASTGSIVVAWARNSASGFDIVVSRFVNDAWTVPQVVAASPAGDLDPQLVLAPDGSVHMFYWTDGATPQVFHTVAPADLSTWAAPVLVSQPGVPSCRPAPAFHNGILRVAYEVHNLGNGNTPREVVLSRFENGAFTTEIVAMTNNVGEVRPQAHSHNGQLWVDWIDHETTEHSGELAWTRLGPQGQWQTIEYEPFTNREQRDYRVRGAARMRAIE